MSPSKGGSMKGAVLVKNTPEYKAKQKASKDRHKKKSTSKHVRNGKKKQLSSDDPPATKHKVRHPKEQQLVAKTEPQLVQQQNYKISEQQSKNIDKKALRKRTDKPIENVKTAREIEAYLLPPPTRRMIRLNELKPNISDDSLSSLPKVKSNVLKESSAPPFHPSLRKEGQELKHLRSQRDNLLLKVSKPIPLNVDEILRIGAVMERFQMSQKRAEAFGWIANHRTGLNKDPRTAGYLSTALGDVEVEKLLAINAVKELQKLTVLTGEDCNQLVKTLEYLHSPITVGQLANFLKH